MFCAAVVAFMLLPAAARAQQYSQTQIYSFCSDTQDHCPDGNSPMDTPPLFDSHGNIYGATTSGGAFGHGVVYKLTAGGGGTYTQSVLYSFCPQSGCLDGSLPYGQLALDAQGNLYGVTLNGGANNLGVLYELSPGGGGSWTYTALFSFCNDSLCNKGGSPQSGPIIDSQGNLYGTTSVGGSGRGGTVYEVSPSGGGQWTYTVLYAFCAEGDCVDPAHPFSSLIFDSHGNLYGTATGGGVNSAGAVFELSPSGGSWTETVLYSFCSTTGCPDGTDPRGNLVFDAQGNLYGTTIGGGSQNSGTTFEISPSGGGSWTENVLVNFCPGPSCVNGSYPSAGVIADAHGNLFGTAPMGGAHGGGTAFELSPVGGGQFAFNVIYQFCSVGSCFDGTEPVSGLVFDPHGNLFGTASSGMYCCGLVYELTPVPLIGTATSLTSSPNPSNLGQEVTMTATVTANNGALPTGTVVFESNGVEIGSGTLDNHGVARLTYAGLGGGTDSLVAVYQGSTTLAGSTSNTVSQVVNRMASTTAVTSSQSPSTFGDPVTLTATVGPAGPPAPSGTVSFTSNGSAISGCTAVPLMLTAQCVTSSLPTGTDAIVATYSGDTYYSGSSGSLSQLVNPVPSAAQFVPVTPCRLVDTRPPLGNGPIPGGTAESFTLPLLGGCNIPATAVAYSLNVTVVPPGRLGFLTIWPTGEGQPSVSLMNSLDGRIKANAAIVPAGTNGAVSVYVNNTSNVLIDIDGYFAPVSSSTLQFFPLTPCRVVDTRNPNGDLAGPFLNANQERDFPVLESSCIPQGANPQAYSFNVTAVPNPAGQRLGFLTIWPKGETRPTVSTLNNLTGTIVANAAIVPAGTNGEVAVYPNNTTDLLIDINGYFAAPGTGGLSLYTLAPCRVLDTRGADGNGPPFVNEMTVNVETSPCAPPATSQAYVFNATVVPPSQLGFLTLWPDGEDRPTASTLNAKDGAITSNMAIVPTSNGSIDAYANDLTQLILDISSYFAP
jgi:uncharacterized repeat protein (TIGR03803 family)